MLLHTDNFNHTDLFQPLRHLHEGHKNRSKIGKALRFKRTFIYFNTGTQYANFRGNSLYQATKQQINGQKRSKMKKRETYLVFVYSFWLMIAYISLFSALLSRLTALACASTWVTSFIARFLNIHRSGVLTALAWLVPQETAAVSAQVLCTPYNHATSCKATYVMCMRV